LAVCFFFIFRNSRAFSQNFHMQNLYLTKQLKYYLRSYGYKYKSACCERSKAEN
jgi:hypothetical protein